MPSFSATPHRLRRPASRIALALAAAVVCGLILLPAARPTHAEGGSPLHIAQNMAACGPRLITGTITFSSSGNITLRGHLHLFLDFRPDASALWARAAGEAAVIDFDVPAGGLISVPYGPLDLTSLPPTAMDARVAFVLDVISNSPSGVTTTSPSADTAVTAGACGTGAPAPVVQPGGAIQLAAVSAICDGFNIQGMVQIKNDYPDLMTVTTSVYLAYQDGGTWQRGPAKPAVANVTITPGRVASTSFTVGLLGVPSDVTGARPEVDVVYAEFISGVAVRRTNTFLGNLATCALPSTQTASGERLHSVQLGDTLATVAARFGTTSDAVAAANSLDVKARLKVGQTLTVPNQSTPTPTPAVSPRSGGTPPPIGLGSAPGRTVAAIVPSPTPTSTATPPQGTPTKTVTPPPTRSPAAAGTNASPSPGASPVPSASPTSDKPDSAKTVDDGNSLFSFIKPAAYAAGGLVAVVCLALGGYMAFRKLRESRARAAETEPRDISAVAGRPRATRGATVAGPADPGGDDEDEAGPLASLLKPESEDPEEGSEASALSPGLRDVFAGTKRASRYADFMGGEPAPAGADILAEATNVIQMLQRRPTG